MERALTVVLWVEALESPKVLRRCARCDTQRRFICSNKFRVNAQKRLLDVWLIYKCEGCDATWNCTIIERCKPEQIKEEEYQGFLSNDEELALRCSFDKRLLQAAQVEVNYRVPYQTTKIVSGSGPEVRVLILLQSPVEVRLEKLLSQELLLPRGRLEELAKQGAINVSPQMMRRSATHNQEVLFSGEAAQLIQERLLL